MILAYAQKKGIDFESRNEFESNCNHEISLFVLVLILVSILVRAGISLQP